MDTVQGLRTAIGLHQSGQLTEAAEIYNRILQAEPENVDALNLLGAILLAAGQFEAAIDLTGKAVDLDPGYFAPYVNLGNALQAAQRLEEAADALAKALHINPGSAAAAANLASVLNDLGRYGEAAAAARQALGLEPDFAEALNNLGNALMGLGNGDEALDSYRRAAAINPSDASVQFNLGNALAAAGGLSEAIGHFERAAGLDPESAEKHFSLANTALALDRYRQAEEEFTKALAIEPDYADALNNLGSALQGQGRLDEAIASFRRAAELEPDSGDLHWNLALALLQDGRFAEGWAEYEWRWKNPDFTTPGRDFSKPRWDGAALDGRTILVHAEQGMGDALLAARFLPLVAQRRGKVILECRAPLARLLATVEGVGAVVEAGDEFPQFDCQIPMMSLPGLFKTTIEAIPGKVPYLAVPETAKADPALAGGGLKVGFAWAGSPTRRDDHKRSVGPGRLKALFEVPGCRFFSLQVGERAGEFEEISERENVHDLAPSIGDFADTATAVQALDLVITVDTALAHLAGALGKPAWVMVPYARSYLWLSGRADSPWYPSLRLFAQSDPGDWDSVLAALREELAALAAAG